LENSDSFKAKQLQGKEYKELFNECLDDPSKMQHMVQYNILFDSDYLSLYEFIEVLKRME
jgi:hypothetical protein